MSYKVHDIANRIILHCDLEAGDSITNLKLQKLLYYMQGYHLAFFDNKFFEDDLEAWKYGPVVPVVYERFEHLGANAIILEEEDVISLKDEEEDMFVQVMSEYGKFSAGKLVEMTHRELPWKEVYGKPKPQNIIRIETMKSFFTKLIDEEES